MTERKKILLYTSYYLPYISGITTYPQKIFEHIAKSHDVTILTFPHEKNLPKEETINNVKVIRMPYLFKVSKGYMSPQSIYHFVKHAWRNEIVFLNLPNFEGIYLAFIAKLFLKKIYTIFHCQVFIGKSIVARILEIALKTSVFCEMLLSREIVSYTKDYVGSLWMGRFFMRKISFVYPPMTKMDPEPKLLNDLIQKKGNKIWIGFAGRVAREKGLQYLIDAAKILNNPNVKLVFAGPYGKDVAGENEYYESIKQKLEENKMDYEFFGLMKGGDLGAFYKAVDMLVLPSINQTEAFGMVQAEAMMLGTPVITSDLPGVRVSVQVTGMGEVVAIKGAEGLSKAVDKLIKNRSEYVDDKKIAYANKIFAIENIFNHYDKIIENS